MTSAKELGQLSRLLSISSLVKFELIDMVKVRGAEWLFREMRRKWCFLTHAWHGVIEK